MVPILIFFAIAVALILMVVSFMSLISHNEGNEEMVEIAKIIRDGAKTFMIAEYKVIIIVVAIIAIALSLFIEKFAGLTFVLGATMSSISCILGMRSATFANVRTTNKARESLSIGETVKIALAGGSISGLSVQAFGLLGLMIVVTLGGGIDTNGAGSGFIAVLQCNPSIMWLTTYSLGCSLVAMFNRVAGGNYTKAADISAAMVIAIGGVASFFIFKDSELYDSFKIGWASPWVSSILGIASGVAIGKITEYYTGTKFKSVKQLAEMATEGSAFVITKGDAIGSRSCLLPILIIAIALLGSGILCGIYGIAIAALGMLSFVATTVSIDAFGPISDNAGGIAESCHLAPEVRAITDQLDAVGNTTAAIGKGFAIGSATFATVSLIFAYVGSYSQAIEPVLNIASFVVIAGGILGGALIEYFSALLTDNTIESAHLMADEGDRQLSVPGVIEGKVKPDYNKCIKMATQQALKKMLAPSLLALLIPVAGGLLFGVEFVGGLLIGATITAIPRAIFMGNSGGAFDNAKKFIESGQLEGHDKGSDAHKASVVGDTVGDTRKDVVGVALDIFIKMMSTVANTLAPLFASIHLF